MGWGGVDPLTPLKIRELNVFENNITVFKTSAVNSNILTHMKL